MPFGKKRKRHGKKSGVKSERYRAFWQKEEKARYKKLADWLKLPCLLTKSVKGTVKKADGGVCATVPFGKKWKRHGKKSGVKGERYRAFWQKVEKARYKKAALARRFDMAPAAPKGAGLRPAICKRRCPPAAGGYRKKEGGLLGRLPSYNIAEGVFLIYKHERNYRKRQKCEKPPPHSALRPQALALPAPSDPSLSPPAPRFP